VQNHDTLLRRELLTTDPQRQHEPFPLTDVQEAYWVGRQLALDLGNVASHTYQEVEWPGVNLDRFTTAVNRLIQRHGMLRAVVRRDARQQVLPSVPWYEPAVIDLPGAQPQAVNETIEALRQRMSRQVFTPERWPLFEICAVRSGDGGTRLHVSFDLLIADAWSLRILGRDIARLYSDPDANLPPLEVSFRDYVLSVRALRATAAHAEARAYWRERAGTLPGGPDLPLACHPASIAKPRFVRRSGRLDAAEWAALRATASRARVTPSGLLLAAFADVLGRWSATPRFVVTVTLFHRIPVHAHVDEIVGDFTSLVLVEVDYSHRESLLARARRVQERLWQDLDHRMVSGVEVLREIGRTKGRLARESIPVVFTSTLFDDPSRARNMPAPGTEIVYGISQTPQVWIDHQVSEDTGGLAFSWDVVEGLFTSDVLDEMFADQDRLLHRLAASEGVQS